MTKKEIFNLEIGCLQTEGYIFWWTLISTLKESIKHIKKIGYDQMIIIPWIKYTTNGKLHKGPGPVLTRSYEILLCATKGKCKDLNKWNQQKIISKALPRMMKPRQQYALIEDIIGERYQDYNKLELFGRTNNLNSDWWTVGRQLMSTKCDFIFDSSLENGGNV